MNIKVVARFFYMAQCQLIYSFSLSFIIVIVVYAVVKLLMSHLYVEMKQ